MKKIALFLMIGFAITTGLNAGKKAIRMPGLDAETANANDVWKVLDDASANLPANFKWDGTQGMFDLKDENVLGKLHVDSKTLVVKSFVSLKNPTFAQFKEMGIGYVDVKPCKSENKEEELGCLKHELAAFLQKYIILKVDKVKEEFADFEQQFDAVKEAINNR